MTYEAAVTNIQGWEPTLGQCVCVMPYCLPIQQAKVAATVDSLSGGRLLTGAGTGYMYDEFETLGIPFKERGDRTDEYLKAMIELRTHPGASFHGRYVNFDNKTMSVRPAQQPHPPVLVGGAWEAALPAHRRVLPGVCSRHWGRSTRSAEDPPLPWPGSV